ncbi:MAG: hypothetical protein B7C55_02850, partial [Actinomycetales bacterium mxb001]
MNRLVVAAAVLAAMTATATGPALAAPIPTKPLNLYAGTRPATAAMGTVTEHTLRTPDGLERSYRLFVPAGLTGRAPLLLALHGGLGSGVQFETNSGFDGLATANGFIVAYPDGV